MWFIRSSRFMYMKLKISGLRRLLGPALYVKPSHTGPAGSVYVPSLLL